MSLLGLLKRLFLARRPSYKPVASTGSRRTSDPPPPELEGDADPYTDDEEVVHGGFVYCAFLMLGMFLQWSLTVGLAMLLRTDAVTLLTLAWFSFTTAAAFFREVFASKPALMKSSTSAIAAVFTCQ